MIPNRTTPEGRELGAMLARFADLELAGRRDNRCATCAFRAGEHPANGSPATLMDALKCAIEGEPFWCHEHDRPCAGWRALRSAKREGRRVAWDFSGGGDELPDVICLPDHSAGGPP
jgi:hypothetical protein